MILPYQKVNASLCNFGYGAWAQVFIVFVCKHGHLVILSQQYTRLYLFSFHDPMFLVLTLTLSHTNVTLQIHFQQPTLRANYETSMFANCWLIDNRPM